MKSPNSPQDIQATLAAALAGRYEIERDLGQGGMAIVFLAKDLRHSRRVAVKVLRGKRATFPPTRKNCQSPG